MLRRPSRRAGRVLASWAGLALLALASHAAPASGQEAETALEEARRLRDAGALDGAASVLRRRLERAPGDVDARWLLAETLYWIGDVEGARAEYARALAARPDDPGLRLDAARFLLETGRPREARDVLAPLAERPPPGWETEVERLARSVRAASAPWVRVAPDVLDDSQPLTRWGVEVEAGYRPADGLAIALRAAPRRWEAEAALPGAGGEVAATEASAWVAYAPPGVPLEVEASAGVFSRDRPETTDAIGELRAAVRLPHGTALRGAASRGPYLWTATSLDRRVLVDALEATLDRSGAPRWAFQAGLRRETFDLGPGPPGPPGPEPAGSDGNVVTSAWAWALAPLLVRDRGSVRAGWAFRWQDSESTRFTPEGVYDPYYTPEEVRVHSAVVAVALRAAPSVTLRADGAVGVWAEERAPQAPAVFAPGPGPPPGPGPDVEIPFVDRDFTPWRVRAGIEAGLGAAARLRAEVERSEDAFFESTRGTASVTWWIGG